MAIAPEIEVRTWSMVIDGERVQAVSGATMDVLNPATDEVIARVPKADIEDMERAIQAARRAFEDGRWSRIAPGARAEAIYKLAQILESRAAEFARIESLNTGKPFKFSEPFDVGLTVDNLKFFAGAARTIEGKGMGEYQPGYTSALRREPIGVIGQVAPWNYPLNMAGWKIGPALAAGNTVILKPASITPLTAIMLGEAALEAGIPAGVLNVITGPGAKIGAYLAEHREVDMISLTGDTSTGQEIMRLAAGTVKRLHLELGGKAPMLVFDDADVDAVVEGALAGGLLNSGQDCTAATRILVQRPIYDAVVKRLVKRVGDVVVGDPFDAETDLGPLISKGHQRKVKEMVETAKSEGGRVLVGGEIPGERGCFFQPTVIVDAAHSSTIGQKEVFGPVLAVFAFDTDEEGIALANDVDFGLSSSVWTRDMRRAMIATGAIRAGACSVNDHGFITSEFPHGGYKQSGFGNDMSQYAFDEYTNIKHVSFELTGATRKEWHDVVVKPEQV